jgi:hypothetical protein
VVEPGGRTVPLAASPVVKFQHPGWWTSAALRPQRLPITRANRFIVFIYTGDDDLRTDPRINPNSELDLFLNLSDGRNLILDTGRHSRRNFVGLVDTAFYGTFQNWGTAWAVATTPEDIELSSVESISVRMTVGRAPHGTLRGTDPFRGDDEWVLNGIWVGVDPTGRAWSSPADGPRVSALAQRIFSQFNVMAKMNAHRPAWTSSLWR